MKIIPVIDIKGGVAVHAVQGRRDQYNPLQSCLCNSADPLQIARAFQNLGFTYLYVADLDAITGKGDNAVVLSQIVRETDLQLWVDAGASNILKAKQVLALGASKIIVGTT